MSIALIVTRMAKGPTETEDRAITLDEWLRLVAGDKELRINQEDRVAVNPRTGERISMPGRPGQSEFSNGGNWEPFLEFGDSRLVMRYRLEIEDPANPVRRKIAQVAKSLGAIITTDAGDELLDW
jgi:hypothetical protein